MTLIKWGIIGCGDVTERKSGPAFNKVNGSSLIAVMRRDADKAKDYALRHSVPKWYSDARRLIDDPEVNAIYIATPPLYHEAYAVAALQVGKPVYLEKPMALNEAASRRINDAAIANNTKLVVAHYRRALPIYVKIKELLDEGMLGEIRFVQLQLLKSPGPAITINPAENWRVDPSLSGGGFFHDLAPHQLDMMLYYFGEVSKASGYSANQGAFYKADDIVSGDILFKSGVIFKGLWCFSVSPESAEDNCEIVGSKGKISFSFFGNQHAIINYGKDQVIEFETPRHVQQPMIEKVVKYFLGEGGNPCSGEEGIEVMRIIDHFTTPLPPSSNEEGENSEGSLSLSLK